MEKDLVTIYKITNIINNKIYIGYDSSYPKRINQHYLDSKKGKNSPLCDDIREYGWENFNKEILYQSDNKRHTLKVMENYFILKYDSFNVGYNRTMGGNGTLNSSRPKSEEWKIKHSERMIKNNPMMGHSYSDIEREHQSKKMKEFYKNNPDRIPKKEKNGMYGKKHTDEWRQNHSECMKKNKNSTNAMIKKTFCIYCGFFTTLGNISRYHNEKCKNKYNYEG